MSFPRHAGADHEADLANALGPLAALPLLAVVLLVGAEVLQQLNAPLPEAGGPVDELLGDVAAQIVARGLEALDGGQLDCLGRLRVSGSFGISLESGRIGENWGEKSGPRPAHLLCKNSPRARG